MQNKNAARVSITPRFLPAPVTQHRPIDTVRGLSYTVPALAAGGQSAQHALFICLIQAEDLAGRCGKTGRIAAHGRYKRML
jgi:hypothetical protein